MSSRRFGSQSLVRLLGHWQQTPSRTPLWRQLADALRLLILDGRLALSTRLPGERELATALDVSRTTISSALAHLREEGYLESRHGSGSRVILPDTRAVPTLSAASAALDLSTAALNAGPEIHQLTRALTAITQHLTLTGYDQLGGGSARRHCRSLYRTRAADPRRRSDGGQWCRQRFCAGTADDGRPGDRVVVDHPTYPLAIAAIRGHRVGRWACRCRKAAGIRMALPPRWRRRHRAAYLMPDFHNPTGRCMDIATRQAITDIAARTRTTLVVDETMVDLWFEAPPRRRWRRLTSRLR